MIIEARKIKFLTKTHKNYAKLGDYRFTLLFFGCTFTALTVYMAILLRKVSNTFDSLSTPLQKDMFSNGVNLGIELGLIVIAMLTAIYILRWTKKDSTFELLKTFYDAYKNIDANHVIDEKEEKYIKEKCHYYKKMVKIIRPLSLCILILSFLSIATILFAKMVALRSVENTFSTEILGLACGLTVTFLGLIAYISFSGLIVTLWNRNVHTLAFKYYEKYCEALQNKNQPIITTEDGYIQFGIKD